MKTLLLHNQWKLSFPMTIIMLNYSKANFRSCDQKEGDFSVDDNHYLVMSLFQF